MSTATVKPMIIPDAPEPTRAWHGLLRASYKDLEYSSEVIDMEGGMECGPQKPKRRKPRPHGYRFPQKHNQGTNGRAWTQEETEKLIKMREEGTSFPDIGKALDRTPDACRRHLNLTIRKNQ